MSIALAETNKVILNGSSKHINMLSIFKINRNGCMNLLLPLITGNTYLSAIIYLSIYFQSLAASRLDIC